jgi:hypothetical protein
MRTQVLDSMNVKRGRASESRSPSLRHTTCVSCVRLVHEGRIVQHYQKRISGTMIDPVDIHLEVASVEVERLAGLTPEEPSSLIRQPV